MSRRLLFPKSLRRRLGEKTTKPRGKREKRRVKGHDITHRKERKKRGRKAGKQAVVFFPSSRLSLLLLRPLSFAGGEKKTKRGGGLFRFLLLLLFSSPPLRYTWQ